MSVSFSYLNRAVLRGFLGCSHVAYSAELAKLAPPDLASAEYLEANRPTYIPHYIFLIPASPHAHESRISFLDLCCRCSWHPVMHLLTNVTSLLSLNAVLENSTGTNLLSNSDVSLYSPRIPLNDTVYARVRETLDDFSSVTFRELQVTSTIGPTTNPELLLDVRLLFSAGHGSLYIDMTGIWGEWAGPRFSVQPWSAENNVLPSRLGMDIVFADSLIKKAGYVGPYEAVDVKWPKGLPLGKEQPYYCFLMEGSRPEFVYVGVNDQRVMTSLLRVGEGVEDNEGTIA